MDCHLILGISVIYESSSNVVCSRKMLNIWPSHPSGTEMVSTLFFLASCLLFWASNSNAFPSRQGAFDVGVQTMPLSVQSIWNASSSLHSSSNTSLGALDWDFYVKTGSIIFDHLQSGCSLDKPNPPTVSSMKQQGWDIGLIGPVMPSPYVSDYALFLMDSKADQWSYYQARANDKPHNGIADLSI